MTVLDRGLKLSLFIFLSVGVPIVCNAPLKKPSTFPIKVKVDIIIKESIKPMLIFFSTCVKSNV